MATFSWTNKSETIITWRIGGLEHPVNKYDRFEIDLYRGSTYINTYGWTDSSASTNTYYDTRGLDCGTYYEAEGHAQFNGVWYYIGWAGTTTDECAIPRPSNFSWTYSKVSGEDFNLTWTEWNNFIARINDFREYDGLSRYQVLDWNPNNQYTGTDRFQKGQSGVTFYAYMYNQARRAIQDMNSSVPSSRSSGDIIYASDLNGLRDALNAIS